MSKRPKHGSPEDRGGADAYYGRPRSPHWYFVGTYNGERIGEDRMSEDEIRAYHKGYDRAEGAGDFKDWG